MKKLICVTTICLIFFIVGASSVQSQTEILEGYTFIRGGTGTSVCLGKWVPSRDVALPGVCQGQMVDVNHLAAISAKQSADKLDQLAYALNLIDQKLAINNDQFQQLIKVTVNTQTLIDQQVRQFNELLREAIIERFNVLFDTLPEEIFSNDLFKEEFKKLKKDILKEVEKHYLKKPETTLHNS
jgi:hypothetical protein